MRTQQDKVAQEVRRAVKAFEGMSIHEKITNKGLMEISHSHLMSIACGLSVEEAMKKARRLRTRNLDGYMRRIFGTREAA